MSPLKTTSHVFTTLFSEFLFSFFMDTTSLLYWLLKKIIETFGRSFCQCVKGFQLNRFYFFLENINFIYGKKKIQGIRAYPKKCIKRLETSYHTNVANTKKCQNRFVWTIIQKTIISFYFSILAPILRKVKIEKWKFNQTRIQESNNKNWRQKMEIKVQVKYCQAVAESHFWSLCHDIYNLFLNQWNYI